MAFPQASVRFDIGSGLPGEFAFDGPTRSQPGVLRTTAPANNVFGRIFSEDAALPGVWRAGDPLNNGERFAMMTSPKQHVSYGTQAGGPQAPSYVLPNETIAEFTTMGILWAAPINARAPRVGDIVRFVIATGEVFTVAPGTAADPLYKDLPNATVVRYPQPAADGLCVIQITQ